MVLPPSLEEQIYNERCRKIGWAILHMNYFERIWWALTGQHEYMTYKYWEEKR